MNEDCAYVEAIARYGSISKAAHMVHLSQPGLSQRLKRIESELGSELFDRSRTPLKLTPTGEVYLRFARTAMAAEENMHREVRGMVKRKRRRIHVGVSGPRANALLVRPIVEFYESHKGCMLVFHAADDPEQLHRLFVDGVIDFAVLTPIVPTPSLYRVEPICEERLLMAISPDFRVPHLDRAQVPRCGSGNSQCVGLPTEPASTTSPSSVEIERCVTPHDLEGIPFALPSCGHYVDTLVERFIDDAGAELSIAVNGCTPELALKLVEDGLGATIVPSTLLQGSSLRIFEVTGLEIGCQLNYVRIADRPVSDEEALLISCIRKCA